MSKLDDLLKGFVPSEKIFDNKPVAHWVWLEKGGHLLIAANKNSERYFVLDNDVHYLFNGLENSIQLSEVIEENGNLENYGPYIEINNYVDEADWLGKYKFLLYRDFESYKERELVANNYDKLIYIREMQSNRHVSLNQDLRLGNTLENSKWAVYWVKYDSPFFLKEGLLGTRKNSILDNVGVIWFDNMETAQQFYNDIHFVASKVGKGYFSQRFPSPDSFMKEFLALMQKFTRGQIGTSDISVWSEYR